MPETRRIYSHDFKIEAVRMVEEEGKSVPQVARDLGINASLIYRWRQRLGKEHGCTSYDKWRPRPAEQDYDQLRQENERLREEVEALKRTILIFSRNS